MIAREIALGLVFDGPRILVTSAEDPESQRTFIRPPGGGIEAGEDAAAAVVREFAEEFGVAVTPVKTLATVEYRFAFAGAVRAERATLIRLSASPGSFDGITETLDKGHRVSWVVLDDIDARHSVLVPPDLTAYAR